MARTEQHVYSVAAFRTRGAQRRLDGVAILFVESKFFDAERARKDKAKARREEVARETLKRKASMELQRSTKKACRTRPEAAVLSAPSGRETQALAKATQNAAAAAETVMVTGDGRSGEMRGCSSEVRAECRARYSDFLSKSRAQKWPQISSKTTTNSIVDLILDDMINAATRDLNCYRIPADVFFGNDLTKGAQYLLFDSCFSLTREVS